jgi:hypothetical protein
LATGFPNEVNAMPTIDRSAGNGDLIDDPTEEALVALGRQGRHRRRDDPAAVPADRRAAIQCRPQADGHLPPDDRRRHEHAFGAEYLACGHYAPAPP